MAISEQRYLSFLLRLWRVKRNGDLIWRASLDDPHTGERRGFASLATLMDFLKQQTQGEDDKGQSNLTDQRHEQKQS